MQNPGFPFHLGSEAQRRALWSVSPETRKATLSRDTARAIQLPTFRFGYRNTLPIMTLTFNSICNWILGNVIFGCTSLFMTAVCDISVGAHFWEVNLTGDSVDCWFAWRKCRRSQCSRVERVLSEQCVTWPDGLIHLGVRSVLGVLSSKQSHSKVETTAVVLWN